MSLGIADYIFRYPGDFGLKSGFNVLFSYQGKDIGIRVNDVWKGIEIADLSNSFTEQKIDQKQIINIQAPVNHISAKNLGIVFEGFGLGLVLDYGTVPYRFFRQIVYTNIVVSFETNETSFQASQDIKWAKEALKYFIENYRIIFNNVNIRDISSLNYNETYVLEVAFTKHDYDFENISVIERIKKPRVIISNIKELNLDGHGVLSPFDTKERDLEKMESALKATLKKGLPISFTRQAINKASEEFTVRKNYKYALLEAFIAVESSLSDLVRTYKLSIGISKKTLDNFIISVPFSYLLNVEFKMIFTSHITADKRDLLSRIDQVRRKRNKIVHESEEVTREEGLNAITACNEFASWIDELRIHIVQE